MKALARLWLYKQRAIIRNIFSKWTSAIFTILMILLYGGIFISMMSSDNVIMLMPTVEANFAILLSIGFSSIFVFTMLFQKRKALFYEEDSFYLFSGPYTRGQVMAYLMAQTILGSFLYSLLSLFMMVTFAGQVHFHYSFMIISFFCYIIMFMFWFNLTDYLYILSITNKKYKIVSKIIAGTIVAFILIVYGITLAQNGFQFSSSLVDFAQSSLFYLIPIFGWMKLAMISALTGNIAMLALGIALLLIACAVLTYFFISFKGDFYEQAMQDSIELSGYMKEVRSGKKSSMGINDKVKKAHVNFKSGAAAIYSKNILLMKKTGSYLRKQDLFILIFYFILALIASKDNGFMMYCYLLMIWVFMLIQDSDMLRELKNYQIYLIPDSPFKKLLYVILPTLLKICIMCIIAITGSGLYFNIPIFDILQYVLMICGYAFLFICASVLSVRIMKSRSNAMMENLMRMLIIIVSAIPSAFVIIFLINTNMINIMNIITQATIISLVMNFIIGFVVLVLCKNMMNGREISSD